jgi:hypothetical protein
MLFCPGIVLPVRGRLRLRHAAAALRLPWCGAAGMRPCPPAPHPLPMAADRGGNAIARACSGCGTSGGGPSPSRSHRPGTAQYLPDVSPWRGGCDVSCPCNHGGTRRRVWSATPWTPLQRVACHLASQGEQRRAVPLFLCNVLKTKAKGKNPAGWHRFCPFLEWRPDARGADALRAAGDM